MTKEEFYLRAMLALASNPKYVEMKQFEVEDNLITHRILQTDEIPMDADRLLVAAEDSWPEVFDKSDDNIKEHLKSIADAVSELNKYGIKTFHGDS